MTKTAYVEIRSQHSVGGANGFGGPDTYVAVQIVPDNCARGPLVCLSREVARKHKIGIKYFGEGYSKNRGSRSALGQAISAANDFATEFNEVQADKFNQLVHHAE